MSESVVLEGGIILFGVIWVTAIGEVAYAASDPNIMSIFWIVNIILITMGVAVGIKAVSPFSD